MRRITILSGKGGTGKTSITSSLAVLLARKEKIIAVDCDVDAPNLGLNLGVNDSDFSWQAIQTSEKAELIKEKCNGCKKCLSVCNFGAIGWNDKENKPIFNSLLCEGCGSCKLICPQKAIKLKKVINGRIGFARTNYGFTLLSGQLKMGESGSGKIIALLKNKAEKMAEKQKAEMMLVDSAAGIGCPVIASVNGSDFVIGITEPSPSALNDLKRGLQVVEHFQIPYGIIINKWDLNKKFSQKIEDFADKYKIPLLKKIPYNKKFVKALINLKPAVVYDKKFENIFWSIINRI